MDAAINRVRAGPESVTIRNQLTSVISQSGYVHSSVINWRRVTTSYHLVVRIGDLGQHRVVCSSDVRRETRGGGVMVWLDGYHAGDTHIYAHTHTNTHTHTHTHKTKLP